jgi:hypothetical protein
MKNRVSVVIAFLTIAAICISTVLAIWGEIFGLSPGVTDAWRNTATVLIIPTFISGFAAIILNEN